MNGIVLDIEENRNNTQKLANYDKLIAKNTELKTNNELLKNLMKDKDKTIDTLRKQIIDLRKELEKYKSTEEQIKMRLD